MQHSKIYSLLVRIEAVCGVAFQGYRQCTLSLCRGTETKVVKSHHFSPPSRVDFNQTVEFQFPEGSLNRESKLLISLEGETDQKRQQLGRMTMLIMDSKNYSQKMFTIAVKNQGSLFLEMRLSMSAVEQVQKSLFSNKQKQVLAKQQTKKNQCTIPYEKSQSMLSEPRHLQNHGHIVGKNDEKSQISYNTAGERENKAIEDKKHALTVPTSIQVSYNSQPRIFYEFFQAIENKMTKIHQKQQAIDEDYLISPQEQDDSNSRLKICHNFSIILDKPNCKHLPQERSTPRKRYQLVKTSINRTEQDRDYDDIGQAYFCKQDGEEESLNRINYIKLSKITHLSKAATIAKSKNSYLLKANEELRFALKQTEMKLEASKRIIKEKENLLNYEFKLLREQLQAVNKAFTLKNDDLAQRDEKIKTLQGIVEQYARDTNDLKEQLKNSQTIIHNLKAVLANKEENEIRKSGESQMTLEVESKRKESPTAISEWELMKDFTPRTAIRKASSDDFKREERKKDKDGDKSDLRVFRKFSHSKNASYDANEPHSARKVSKESKTDLIFDKLAMLCSGLPNNTRLLQHL